MKSTPRSKLAENRGWSSIGLRTLSCAALTAALASLAGPLSAKAPGESSATPPAGPPKDVAAKIDELKAKARAAHEEGKAAREEGKEARKEGKEARDEAREARQDAKDARKDAIEALKDLRGPGADRLRKLIETRMERRREHRDRVKTRWGRLLDRPDALAELRMHALRSARLKRMRFVAETERTGKDQEKILARIDKLIEKENARHERAMERHQSGGGAPSAAPSVAAAPAASAARAAAPIASGGKP